MISVKDAILKVEESVPVLESVRVKLMDALGFTVSEDVYSPISFPPFDQSAMDGYAICSENGSLDYSIVDILKAGDSANNIILTKGESCRIFTGAVIPKGATAVVKQEDVTLLFGRIHLNNSISDGENIRPLGEQIMVGELALRKGTLINAGAIGFLATLGIKELDVIRKPRIQIIATGSELIQTGELLEDGKIYESNTDTLIAALRSYGFDAESIIVNDNYDKIKEEIQNALMNNDLLIITGGISVGDYDFVGTILNEINVEQVFYKVKQKPGKPLYFGKKDDTIIFALPGNPAAVLTSFYMYVLTSLEKLSGRKKHFLKRTKATLLSDFSKGEGLTFLLKGRVENNKVEILPAQSSAMLSSFICANCLVSLPEGKSTWKADEKVDLLLIN